jgi:hypothetical protein
VLRERASERRQGKVYFPQGWLSGFAVHHIEANRVAIRVALPFMYGMRAETVHQLGLLLPRPVPLRAALDDAAALRRGFLMKNASVLPRASQTRISIVAP